MKSIEIFWTESKSEAPAATCVYSYGCKKVNPCQDCAWETATLRRGEHRFVWAGRRICLHFQVEHKPTKTQEFLIHFCPFYTQFPTDITFDNLNSLIYRSCKFQLPLADSNKNKWIERFENRGPTVPRLKMIVRGENFT